MMNISPGVLTSKSGGWDLPNHQQSTSKRDSQMTNEEYRNYVYNQYDTMNGVYKNSPERCYELINERQKPQPTIVRNSTNNHYYKIKW